MSSKVTKRVCSKCQFEDETGILKVCPRDGSALTSRGKDPLIGQVIAEKYEIISMLGKGGMSVVYKAKHNMMNRTVAVKMLRPELVAVPQLLQRFQQESNAVSALRHPNIVTVFDYGLLNSSGTPYIIMDYLEGDTLAHIIKKEGGILKPERAIPLFAQACDALAHSHDHGVIHRDIKPANLLIRVEKNGEESLTIFDFGIAKLLGQDGSTIHKLTTSGEVFGSPLYMSPEQCSGERVTKSTDLYSLACVFYETIAGQAPLGGTSPMETLMKHVNEDPLPIREVAPDKEIPEALEFAIMQALEKDPGDRQIDMREFRDQILDAGNLRVNTTSLRMTSDGNLSAKQEDVISAATPRKSSAGVPQPSSKRSTTKSAQIQAYKGKALQALQNQEQQKKEKKLAPLMIGLAVLLALGVMVGGVYLLINHNAPNVVTDSEKEESTTSSTYESSSGEGEKEEGTSSDTETEEGPPANFDGNVTIEQLKGSDSIQLNGIEKEFNAEVDFKGTPFNAIPPALLDTPNPGKEEKVLIIPVLVKPSNISCQQAAIALFDKIFDTAKKPTWEKITDGFGDAAESKNVLIQEITFPPEMTADDKDAGGAETTDKAKSEDGEDTDAASTSKDDATTAGTDKSKDAEGAKEDDSSSESAANADEAGGAKKVYKEYIIYLKHKKQLVACQFVPIRITEEELEKTVKEFLPRLEGVVHK